MKEAVRNGLLTESEGKAAKAYFDALEVFITIQNRRKNDEMTS